MLLGRHTYRLFESLRKAPFSVLMLDYDGTLSPFTSDRDKARMRPGLPEILERIMTLKKTKVAMVTGRTAENLASLLNVRPIPEIWGSHGWERRRKDGSYYLWPADERHLEGLEKAVSMAKLQKLGKFCEFKPRSLAVHWRGLNEDEIEELRRFKSESLSEIAEVHGLNIREFDGGYELRVPGRNKGNVVEDIIEESPPDSFFAYLGDDSTDEDAFRAIEGRGAGILVDAKYSGSMADYTIERPEELTRFFENWEASVRGGAA